MSEQEFINIAKLKGIKSEVDIASLYEAYTMMSDKDDITEEMFLDIACQLQKKDEEKKDNFVTFD